ncbi:uncharacterized protein ALTATR162_LOCUS24 [Alternaria atra]|uniref:Uncharacterized protein n=1 Tax=Alternaria atra TaxID=119953 RepID=A0A8J2HT63_9PLEO|nr:uncharacterized protein ALTATR162_LOCUS24 [Alternaria atra]CAG5136964.1 unnamed protein product [Alternaria atra]
MRRWDDPVDDETAADEDLNKTSEKQRVVIIDTFENLWCAPGTQASSHPDKAHMFPTHSTTESRIPPKNGTKEKGDVQIDFNAERGEEGVHDKGLTINNVFKVTKCIKVV